MPRFTVEESVTINAGLDKVRSLIRNFREWESWSPWLSAEPDCKLSYPADGKSYSWDGKIIGSGEMELVKEEDRALWYRLTFLKPWKSQSDVDFQFAPAGDGTKVTWRMAGSLPFFLFWMKKQMCAWISLDYRRGLSKLKDYAESGEVPSQAEFVGVGEGVVSPFVGLRTRCSFDEIGPKMSAQYGQLATLMKDRGVEPSGAPFAIYHKWDMVGTAAEYTAAIPLKEIPGDLPSEFTTGTVDAPKTYKVKHTGAYRHLGAAWSAGMMHARGKTFKQDKSRDPFEVYVSDPTSTDEAALVTEVHFPAR